MVSARSGGGLGGERGWAVRVFGSRHFEVLTRRRQVLGRTNGPARTNAVDADGCSRGRTVWRPAAAPHQPEMLDYASTRRQEQIMLWVRAGHRATVLTFSTPRTR